MNELEKIRAWNQLKTTLRGIVDYQTRQTYYKALLARAVNEWGFNPENPGQKTPTENIELDDWEKEFVEDINDMVVFGIDVRKEKREQEKRLNLGQMKMFIEHGGSLKDIPENIRTPNVQNLYWEALFDIGRGLCQAAEDLTKE